MKNFFKKFFTIFLILSISSGNIFSGFSALAQSSDLGTAGRPALSCQHIKKENPSAPSGVYSIQSRGMSMPRDFYCDMITAGGGWTLLFQRAGGTQNRESFGGNLNEFLHSEVGNPSQISFGDSYSTDIDWMQEKYSKYGEYLNYQYQGNLVIDSDDAYIITSENNIFPNRIGDKNGERTGGTNATVDPWKTSVSKICDIDNANCGQDFFWIYTGDAWFEGSVCTGKYHSNNADYKGNYGYCSKYNNDNTAYTGSANNSFGNRRGYAETKLWGYRNNVSQDYAERFFVRDSVAPTLRATSATSVNIKVGQVVPELDLEWNDNFDGIGTSHDFIEKTGSVNNQEVGSYTVRYTYRDSSGNISNTIEYAVNVQPLDNTIYSPTGGNIEKIEGENFSESMLRDVIQYESTRANLRLKAEGNPSIESILTQVGEKRYIFEVVYNDGSIDEVQVILNVLPKIIPATNNTKPNGYKTVIFESSSTGTLQGETRYFVNPNVEVTLNPPNVTPIPAFVFDGWNKSLTGIFNDDTTVITARYREIPRAEVVLNEVAYKLNDVKDWVELYNPTDQEINISGFGLKDGTDATNGYSSLIFPQGTKIPSKGYITFANESFAGKYNIEPSIIRDTTGTLNLGHTGTGYFVSLVDNHNRTLDVLSWGTNGATGSLSLNRLSTQNFCKLPNGGVWSNQCQQTPNASNSQDTPVTMLSNNVLVHGAIGENIGNFTTTGNGIDKNYVYELWTTGDSKKFEIISGNILKIKDSEVVDYFADTKYEIKIKTIGDFGGYSEQDFVINVIEPKYNVTYRYENLTPNKTMPTSIVAPNALDNQTNGTTINAPANPDSVIDANNDGIWIFKGWNHASQTINKADIEFVGNWEFVPNKYSVTHRFESVTTGKNLPANMPTLANIVDKITGDSVEPIQKIFEKISDDALDGEWNFDSWTPASLIINKDNAEFVGKWIFTPKTYSVTHSFVAKDTSKTLPQDIIDRIPVNQTSKINNENVTPTENFSKNFVDSVNDGTWNFDSWDQASKTISKDNVNFEGRWAFVPNYYEVNFAFAKSATTTKELPAEITVKLPAKITQKINGETITPETFAHLEVADGTWEFAGWDQNSKTIAKDNLNFVGTWNFVPKPAKIISEFVSADANRPLPQEALNIKPQDQNVVYGDQNILKNFDAVAVATGTWTIQTKVNEDGDEIVNKDIEKNIYTWNFVPKPAKIISEFISADNSRLLPAEVLALKPQEKVVNYEENIIFEKFSTVDVATGTWTMTASVSEDSDMIVNKDIEKNIYTWTFEPKSAMVKYIFNSATTRELPNEVKTLLPSEKATKYEAIENPVNPANTQVAVATGIWTFNGYDANSLVVDSDEEFFTGTWTFAPTPATLKYSFKNISTIKTELPKEVTDLKPNDKPTTFESIETCQDPVQTRVEVADGYWNFKNFSKNSITIANIEETCEANWDFEYKKSTIEYTYESITNGKTLPENIVNSKPANEEANFADNKTATEPQQKTFEVEDGTWNFVEYVPSSLVVDENKEIFTGKWKFTPSVVDNENDKLPNFVSVTFASEEIKGTLSNTLTFWVHPDKNITLTAPTVTAKTGYTFANWDKNISGNFAQNTTINAVYAATIPTAENKVVKLSENIPAIEDFVTNKTNLPDGATFAWEGGEPVKNINSLEKIAKNIIVTYKDGSVHTLSVEIIFVDDIAPTLDDIADVSAIAGENIAEISVTTSDNIAVVDTQVSGLPNGLTFANGKISGTIDANAEIKTYNIAIAVKDAANNSTIKNFAINLASQSSKYSPQAKKQVIEVKNEITAKNSIENADALPQGTTFAGKTGTEPNNQVIGTNISAKVVVTYPDNSTDEIDVILDIVDTTKPTLSGTQNVTMQVGSDEAKNYVLNSGIIAVDNYDTNLAVNCTSHPAYNANQVGTYTLTCTTQDSSGNISENFSKNIIIEAVDKQKLRDLLDTITNDFNTNPDKITNPDIGNTTKDEIQKALDNPNLTADELDKIFEKFKDTTATRDTTPPNATITADVTDPINGNVTLTLTVDEPLKTTPDGWTQDPNNPLVYTKIVSNNENIALEVEDNYGNKTPITHSVNNIDKQNPAGQITADVTDPTNGNVTLTLTTDEPIATPDGWTKVDDKTFTKIIENNQNVEVTLRDPAGNETKLAYNVDNIDKTPPSGEITGSPVDWTNNNVKLTLTTTKPVETPQGWTKVSDTIFEKILEENATGELTLTDNVGNNSTAKITYNVSKIDKEKPVVTTLTVEGDKTLIQSATVTINFAGTDTGGSDIKEYQCKIGNENFSPCTSPFTFNNLVEGENIISVRVVDNAGNISDNKDISIIKDSTAPKFTNLENKEFDEDKEILPIPINTDGNNTIEVSGLPDGLTFDPATNTITGTPTTPGNYEIKIIATDEAGNKTEETITIVIKDKTAPIFTNLSHKEFDEDTDITPIVLESDMPSDRILVKNLPTGLIYDENTKTISGIPTTPGQYTIDVEAIDEAGNSVKDTFVITIRDITPPTITLNSGLTETLVKGKPYTEAGATCSDNVDTNCNVEIIGTIDSETLGEQTITYKATDSAGNETIITKKVTIISGETPIIAIVGNATEFVELGDAYTDAGATAFDDEDKGIANSIVINNSIDTQKLGTYTVTYDVTDSSGNNAPQMIRQVIVRDTTKPTIADISDKNFNEKTPITPIDIVVSDLNPVLNIAVNGLPIGLVYNANTRQIEGQIDIIGTHNITLIATDGSGNISEKTFKIVISDATIPTIEGKDNFKFLAGSSEAKSFKTFENIFAKDNNDADIQNKMQCDVTPQYDANKYGTYTVTCNVTDTDGNQATPFVRTIVVEQRVTSGPGGGGGSSGTNTPITTPSVPVTPTIPTIIETPIVIPESPKTPTITDHLPSQSLITPTGEVTPSGQKIFKLNNRVTDYVCENIVQAYNYPSLIVTDNPLSSTFHDDISALMMFRGLEKNEMNLGQTYEEYKKHGVVLNVTQFEPQRNVTRAEFVKMLVRSLSCRYTYMGTDTGFNDVAQDKWYAEYIKFAVENGWINGYQDNSFRPNNPITRDEAAKILSRAIKLETNNTTTTNFTDISNNSEFIPYIETLKSHGIMKGRNNTTFAPKSYIPRTETSRMIYRTFFGGQN